MYFYYWNLDVILLEGDSNDIKQAWYLSLNWYQQLTLRYNVEKDQLFSQAIKREICVIF